MAPWVCLTWAVTPSDPLAPCPAGQGTSLPAPAVQMVGATAVRYDVKAAVVPEPSERCTTWIAVDGRLVLPSAAIILSFQVLTLPAKIEASVSGLSFRLGTLERLYSMATPPPDHGMWRTWPPFATAADSSSGFMTASLAPKSTVPAVNCWMPAPDPTP